MVTLGQRGPVDRVTGCEVSLNLPYILGGLPSQISSGVYCYHRGPRRETNQTGSLQQRINLVRKTIIPTDACPIPRGPYRATTLYIWASFGLTRGWVSRDEALNEVARAPTRVNIRPSSW